jgi:hypothetical protein
MINIHKPEEDLCETLNKEFMYLVWLTFSLKGKKHFSQRMVIRPWMFDDSGLVVGQLSHFITFKPCLSKSHHYPLTFPPKKTYEPPEYLMSGVKKYLKKLDEEEKKDN